MKEFERRDEWVRFESYQIEASGMICPTPGSDFEHYEPAGTLLPSDRAHETEGEATSAANQGPPSNIVAVESLLEVCGLYERLSTQRLGLLCSTLNPKDDEENALRQMITDWCCKFGLLGILPHHLSFYRARPTVSIRNHVVAFSQERWHRFGGNTLSSYLRLGEMPFDEAQKRWDFFDGFAASDEMTTALSEDFARMLGFEDTGVLCYGFMSSNLLAQTLSAGLKPYFPRVLPKEAERFAYPHPATPKFWAAYAEPVDEFMRYAQALSSIYTALAYRGVPERENETDYALYRLNILLARVSRQVVFDRQDKLRTAAKSPSLIGSLADGIAQCLEQDTLRRRCLYCRGELKSRNPRARYCPEHREAGRKQRQRQNKLKAANSRSV